MRFVFSMAWRDSRASRWRLLLFSLSVVIGIAALVSIGSFTANLRQAIASESKALLGADFFVTSPEPLGKIVTDYLDHLGGQVARERMFSSMMTFPTADGAVRLVQVRALEGGFPFYGEFVTNPEGAPDRLKQGGPVIILEETLLRQFNVRVGDSVKLGKIQFKVVGALEKIPGDSMGASLLAPRVFIPMEEVPATGLAGAIRPWSDCRRDATRRRSSAT